MTDYEFLRELDKAQRLTLFKKTWELIEKDYGSDTDFRTKACRDKAIQELKKELDG